MKSNILKFICGVGVVCCFWACKNGDNDFPDYEGGTTVYFAHQYPVRTIVLGDDEYDTTLDKQHKCEIKATFGGSYNGSNGTVSVAVDETLVNNLYFADGVTPVKAMPTAYYSLSTTDLAFKGTFYGTTEVSLTDAFFADPDAIKNTYVIPLVMTNQSGFDHILTGKPIGDTPGSRCNPAAWDVQPMDYVLYCVKYQNKYSGWWLTNHTMSTDSIEKAKQVQITTQTLNSSVYTVEYQDGGTIYKADLLLTFNGDNCTISSLTPGVTATGNGVFGDNTEKKAWGNKDRDGMELHYTVTFDATHQWTTDEKLVWMRSGVVFEEFAPVYI